MKNVIYRITNLVNGKVYIGLTTQGLLQRQREHISRLNSNNRNHKLYQAMRKYGISSFVFDVIFVSFDSDYLAIAEQELIKTYNSFNRGYNMTIGGDTVSEETKQKLSRLMTGRKITWYDKILQSRKNNTQDRRQKYHTIMNDCGLTFEVWNLREFCTSVNIDVSNFHHYKKKNKFLKGYLLIESSTTSQLA